MLDVAQEPAPSADVRPAPDPRRYVAAARRLPLKLRWQLAAWLRAAGALAEAEAVLDAIARERGSSGTLLEERALLAQAAGDAAAAERFLRERVALAPSATAQLTLARFLLDAGRLDEAAAIGRELDRTDPELATVLQFRARLARATGNLPAARAALEAIIERRPDHTIAMAQLAELDLDAGKTESARVLIGHALDLVADKPPTGFLTAAIAIFAALGDDRATTLQQQFDANVAERRRALAAAIEAEIGLGEESPHPGEESPHPDVHAPTLSRRRERVRNPRPELPLSSAGERGLGGEGSSHSPQPSKEPTALTASADPAELDPRVLPVLREQFGFAALRPGQAAVIANVLAGRDTLATMPTGAGKSLTFQLPAMLLDGVTLVLSPLIALMKDQVEGLPAAVRDRAVLVNSSLSPEEQRAALERIAAGAVKLVYAAPERLRQAGFLAALRAAGVALVVIDEAHCISLWGHDFRPDYLSIPVALSDFAHASVLAITATATPEMADAIAAGLRRPLHRVQASVFRPNLFYEVYRLPNRDAKVERLLSLAEKEQGPGIVYVTSRRDTELVAARLRERGIGAVPYHAGLERDLRAANQRRFMSGGARVVVATVAFGMGVDKANVRWIIHLTPPMSVAAYAQESGRAGRDGQLAHCVLLATVADRTSLLTLARRDEIDLATLRRVYAAVQTRAAGRWVLTDVAALVPEDAEDPFAERDRTRIALGVLEQAGLLTRHPDTAASRGLWTRSAGNSDGDAVWAKFRAWSGLDTSDAATLRTADACAALDLTPVQLERLLAAHADEVTAREGPRVACFELHPAPPDTRAKLEALLDRSREAARARIDEVFGYAAADTCRHVVLAAHLGERIERCATVCDVCTGRAARRAAATPAERPARHRRTTGAADALAVLEAVRTLPFPVGKTGLVRLLAGSAESSIRADRSPSYGVLADVVKARVEGLVDRLIADGFLFRDMGHEFLLITLTDRGRAATADDLAGFQMPAATRSPRAGGAAVAAVAADAPLDAEGEAVLERLAAWRSERAAADGVPAYVVAHNTMLHDLALSRPRTTAELADVSGFGGKRIEKYGAEILAIIADP